MARVKTRLIPTGVHHSPEGEVNATPDRLKHWVSQFQKMRAKKMNVPVPWGHTSDATPENKAFLTSRYNAGTVENLSLSDDGQSLDVTIDAPGLQYEDGNLVSVAKLDNGVMVKTAIKEVSAGIKRSLQDGTGETLNDVLAHVALVTHPVVAGQEGFQGLSQSEGEISNVSFSPCSWNLALDTDAPPRPKKTKKNPNDPPSQAEGQRVSGNQESSTDGHSADGDDFGKEDGDDDDDGLSGESSSGYSFESLLANLAELGAALPPDTTEKNICDRLWVASTALLASRNPAGQKPANPGSMNMREEQPDQMMLSLVREKPELKAYLDGLKSKAEALEATNKQLIKADKERRLDSLKTRLNRLSLSTKVRESHFAALEAQNLSLDDDSLDLAKLESSMDLAESLIGDEMQTLSRRVTDAEPLDNPLNKATAKEQAEAEKHLEDMKRFAGVPSKA